MSETLFFTSEKTPEERRKEVEMITYFNEQQNRAYQQIITNLVNLTQRIIVISSPFFSGRTTFISLICALFKGEKVTKTKNFKKKYAFNNTFYFFDDFNSFENLNFLEETAIKERKFIFIVINDLQLKKITQTVDFLLIGNFFHFKYPNFYTKVADVVRGKEELDYITLFQLTSIPSFKKLMKKKITKPSVILTANFEKLVKNSKKGNLIPYLDEKKEEFNINTPDKTLPGVYTDSYFFFLKDKKNGNIYFIDKNKKNGKVFFNIIDESENSVKIKKSEKITTLLPDLIKGKLGAKNLEVYGPPLIPAILAVDFTSVHNLELTTQLTLDKKIVIDTEFMTNEQLLFAITRGKLFAIKHPYKKSLLYTHKKNDQFYYFFNDLGDSEFEETSSWYYFLNSGKPTKIKRTCGLSQ